MKIGEKVKALRSRKNLTLKQLSELTNLSTGFLSQFERGITTIDVDHLEALATILNVKINYFFDDSISEESVIMRGYNQPVTSEMNQTIYKNLSKYPEDKAIAPTLVELLPKGEHESPKPYVHPGEEFIYVLDGVLTLLYGDRVDKLYAGDSAHLLSTHPHNWDNESNHIVKLLVVHFPNDSQSVKTQA